ncbi:uncharacterized protein PWA37_002817 [Arxiozyma heterogenica]|uniref:uncharacterized protein n=1 Tax=Arxiozyma heterogenica TaxID=278026 RepID=UPI002F17555D
MLRGIGMIGLATPNDYIYMYIYIYICIYGLTVQSTANLQEQSRDATRYRVLFCTYGSTQLLRNIFLSFSSSSSPPFFVVCVCGVWVWPPWPSFFFFFSCFFFPCSLNFFSFSFVSMCVKYVQTDKFFVFISPSYPKRLSTYQFYNIYIYIYTHTCVHICIYTYI